MLKHTGVLYNLKANILIVLGRNLILLEYQIFVFNNFFLILKIVKYQNVLIAHFQCFKNLIVSKGAKTSTWSNIR